MIPQRLITGGRFFLCIAVFALALQPSRSANARVRVTYDTASPVIDFAVDHLSDALEALGEPVAREDVGALREAGDIHIVTGDAALAENLSETVQPEGYEIRVRRRGDARQLTILAQNATGAMYGVLATAEQIRMGGGLAGIQATIQNPRFPFRAIKFNLPWYPYRDTESTALHLSVCRDLSFWREFLDMMAVNRFNALTLWNQHPFPTMIRSTAYPEACPYTEAEMTEWRHFWHSLFRMARDRGIETYLVNWNIVVSPAFADAYGVAVRNDTSQIVKDYTRASVTQVLNEYPNLTGLGVTLADWMRGMSPSAKQDWIAETFIAGLQQANRPAKFIHRSVLSASPADMRRVIDAAELPDPVIVEVKFNWSHGHSTPQLALTHDDNSGRIMEGFWNPTPENYSIAWMIRNEDIFQLRWGEPDFIRAHIATNGGAYVGGYFVGSEGNIPAVDASHRRHRHQTWQYAFQKQWLFYMQWGRLLYDPDTPDAVFAQAFTERYGGDLGAHLVRAYALGSRMPLRFASFHVGTWDFTLYSEGFLEPRKASGDRGYYDNVSPFVSVDELIHHQTLDPQYVSIPIYVTQQLAQGGFPAGAVTPPDLAASLERDGDAVLEILAAVRPHISVFSGALECEAADLETWAYLSHYFARKLRGGVALHRFRETGDREFQQMAVEHLTEAAEDWAAVARVTRQHYRAAPYIAGFDFHWEHYLDQARRDVAIARAATPEQTFPYR